MKKSLNYLVAPLILLLIGIFGAQKPQISHSLRQFEDAASLYSAHLDAQTDQDMSELMLTLAQQNPELMGRYASLMANQRMHTATLSAPQ